MVFLCRTIQIKENHGELMIEGNSQLWTPEIKKDVEVSYSFDLVNGDTKSYRVLSVEPMVKGSMTSSVKEQELAVKIEKQIKPKDTVLIKGKLTLDTQNITKEELSGIFPVIISYKIKLDNNRELILNIAR